MLACPRIVDKATTNDDSPAPGDVMAEALQLSRKDPANVSRLLSSAMKKLDSPLVQVRVKALKFLLHLSTNGPQAVQAEVKLYSSNLSNCIGWRGAPHPTRGFEAYTEMKDLAQQLLDLVFTESARPVVVSVSSTNSKLKTQKGSGVYSMDSYGQDLQRNQPDMLKPKNNDPNKFDPLNKIKKKLGVGTAEPPPTSIYGQYSNTSPNAYFASEPPPFGTKVYGASHNFDTPIDGYDSNAKLPDSSSSSLSNAYNAPSNKRGQFDRLSQEANWKSKTSELAPKTKKLSRREETPASKLMNITGKSSAMPTNSELTAFLGSCTGESIEELEIALTNPEWKVRLRAVHGLEVCGQKFGWGAVAHLKNQVLNLTSSPQNSLKKISTKFVSLVEGVEPTGIPQAKSAFDFSNIEVESNEEDVATVEVEEEIKEFDFGGGDNDVHFEI